MLGLLLTQEGELDSFCTISPGDLTLTNLTTLGSKCSIMDSVEPVQKFKEIWSLRNKYFTPINSVNGLT